MESTSIAGNIQLNEKTYEQLSSFFPQFDFSLRGETDIKVCVNDNYFPYYIILGQRQDDHILARRIQVKECKVTSN